MSRPEIDTLDGVIYHGEDLAEKRYKRTDEITDCPNFGGTCRGNCLHHMTGDRGNYCFHPVSRKKVIRDGILDNK